MLSQAHTPPISYPHVLWKASSLNVWLQTGQRWTNTNTRDLEWEREYSFLN